MKKRFYLILAKIEAFCIISYKKGMCQIFLGHAFRPIFTAPYFCTPIHFYRAAACWPRVFGVFKNHEPTKNSRYIYLNPLTNRPNAEK